MMLVLKDSSVIHEGLQPEMYYALGVAAGIHYKMFGTNCVVTALLDGIHNLGSLHSTGYAGDIRTMDLNDTERDAYVAEVKNALQPMGFDVVPEKIGSTPATTQVHLHIEFDPKGRVFWHSLTEGK